MNLWFLSPSTGIVIGIEDLIKSVTVYPGCFPLTVVAANDRAETVHACAKTCNFEPP